MYTMTSYSNPKNLVFVAVTPSLKVAKWPKNTKNDIRRASLPNHFVTSDLLDFDPISGEVFTNPQWYVWATGLQD